MGKINQLSFAVANLIAAGEVVDRPASVVKELLENSIDAGADSITVEINRGGVSLIRVSDNGCGMSKEDLPLSIKRHATSKISDAQDLDSIATLGFRGEALAAISAVSDVKILSKMRDSELGYLLSSSGGGEVDVCEVGCADGTTVIVENIFANVPARRKFLKKDITEAIAVSAVVEKIALSRPNIAFTYIIDGQTRFTTAGDGKIKNTVYAVLGRDFASRLVEVKGEYDGIFVYGFVGRSDNSRANRNMQNFFINGRYVKSKTACAAIEQAYSSYIAEGRFPVCVLFIDISPMSVDVNVHPAKLEVKFSNEKAVFEAVYYSIKSAVESYSDKTKFELPSTSGTTPKRIETFNFAKQSDSAYRPSTATLRPASNAFAPMTEQTRPDKKTTLLDYQSSFRLKNTSDDAISFHVPEREERKDSVGIAVQNSGSPLSSRSDVLGNYDAGDPKSLYRSITQEVKEEVAENNCLQAACDSSVISECEKVEDYRIIGVCFNTYILVEQGQKLLLIDKHAAHERIIFEELKKNLKKITHASQMMLLPIQIKLSHEEYSAALEYAEEIKSTGFEFSVNASDMTARIDSIPDMIDISKVQDLFVSVLDNLSNQIAGAQLTRDAVYEKALYQSSCKAAVKGGRYDSEENIKWICDTLMSIPDIKVCPHGRPVITELDKRYIDRQFERIK